MYVNYNVIVHCILYSFLFSCSDSFSTDATFLFKILSHISCHKCAH